MVDITSRDSHRRVVTATADPDLDPQIFSDDVDRDPEQLVMAPDDAGASERDYGAEYSDESFWAKVVAFALKAGREVIRLALTLYNCLQDEETPKWARTVIVGALGYFIFPADVIPDFVPGAGFTDDLAVLMAAVATVMVHIKPEHREQAEERMKEWFGNADGD
jgi:uncharacterized membrane protein YkvA (DUF1232 family)